MNQILKTAYDRVSIQGYIEYGDFAAMKPPGQSAAQWSRSVKKALLEAGFVCHEKSKIDKWQDKCSYTRRRTHFHLFRKH